MTTQRPSATVAAVRASLTAQPTGYTSRTGAPANAAPECCSRPACRSPAQLHRSGIDLGRSCTGVIRWLDCRPSGPGSASVRGKRPRRTRAPPRRLRAPIASAAIRSTSRNSIVWVARPAITSGPAPYGGARSNRMSWRTRKIAPPAPPPRAPALVTPPPSRQQATAPPLRWRATRAQPPTQRLASRELPVPLGRRTPRARRLAGQRVPSGASECGHPPRAQVLAWRHAPRPRLQFPEPAVECATPRGGTATAGTPLRQLLTARARRNRAGIPRSGSGHIHAGADP
jgi:hypothetical protein